MTHIADCDNCGGQGVDPGDQGNGTFLCTICDGCGKVHLKPWKPHECYELRRTEPSCNITSYQEDSGIVTYLTTPQGDQTIKILKCPFCGDKLPEINYGETIVKFNPPE